MQILKPILNLLQFIILLLSKKYTIIAKIFMMYQQLQICKRYFKNKDIKLPFEQHKKALIHKLYKQHPKARKFLQLVKPETVLYKWKKYLDIKWTSMSIKKPGRPRITKVIKELIKSIKIDNYLWGCRRIHDELNKLSIDISRETII